MTGPTRFIVEGVHVRYDVLDAVRNVSFSVRSGKSLALVGHNGAGKSSAFLAIAGCFPSRDCGGTLHRHADSGEHTHTSISSARAPWVSMVPEREKVFSLLTVQENLEASTQANSKSSVRIADVYDLLPRMAERRSTLAGNLSGGEQQMLAIGSALLASPQLLLIDEPTLGLAVPAIQDICEKLRVLRTQLGLAMVVALAESRWVAELSDHAIVVERGEVVTQPLACRPGIDEELDRILAGQGSAASAREGIHA